MLHELEEIALAEKRVVEKIEDETRALLSEGEKHRALIEQEFKKETGSIEGDTKNYLKSELKRLNAESGEKMKQIEKEVRAILVDETCRGRMVARMIEMLINSS